MPDINAPYPYFANPSKGVPLANGYIYIGLPDLDPTIPANQVTVFSQDVTFVVVGVSGGVRIRAPQGAHKLDQIATIVVGERSSVEDRAI